MICRKKDLIIIKNVSLSSSKIKIFKILKLRNKFYRHLNFFDIYFLGVLLYKYNLNLVINEIPKK